MIKDQSYQIHKHKSQVDELSKLIVEMSINIQPSFITIEKLQSEVEDYLSGS